MPLIDVNQNRYKLFTESKKIVLRNSIILTKSLDDAKSEKSSSDYTQALKVATLAYNDNSFDYQRLQGLVKIIRKDISMPIISNNLDSLERAINYDANLMSQRLNNNIVYRRVLQVLNISLWFSLSSDYSVDKSLACVSALVTSSLIWAYSSLGINSDIDFIGKVSVEDNPELSELNNWPEASTQEPMSDLYQM